MTSKVTYNGNLRTTCEHLKSGATIITDAPTDNNGKGEAFSPTDMVATALASCMITIMGIAAERHGIDLEGTTAEVNKIMSGTPRKIETIEVTITFPSKGYTNDQHKLLEKVAHACPVGRSLHPDLRQEIVFIWEQEQ